MLRAVWIGVCLLALTGYGYAQPSPPPGERSGLSSAEIRELLDAVKATATASRENVDHARVVPDLLFQILTKLDKIEDKLDRVENAIKRNQALRTNAR
jgi:hypothetical protein